MDTSDVKSLEEIEQAEAVELLGTESVGRLIYTRFALPAVMPVNYAVREDAVWVWTASESSLAQAVRGAVIGFEVDHLEYEARTGWSVLVLGVAEVVTDPEVLERARMDGPEPWVPGRKVHLLRVPLSVVSGRRIDPWFPPPAHTL
jgi:nitroimidazol reductase NimA-like FMN-containing flavoprotein (pyridoxamine 5'-phosphate oxidase superfamily)